MRGIDFTLNSYIENSVLAEDLLAFVNSVTRDLLYRYIRTEYKELEQYS